MTEMTEISLFDSETVSTISDGLPALTKSLGKYKSIVTDDDLAKASEILAQAKKFKRDIENERTEMIRPYLDVQQAVNGEANKLKAQLDTIIKHFDNVVKIYMRTKAEAERIAREEAEQQLLAQRKEENAGQLEELHEQLKHQKAGLNRIKMDDTQALMSALQEINTIVNEIRRLGGEAEAVVLTSSQQPARAKGVLGSTTTLGEKWTFELVDFAAVPNDLKILDEKAVRARIAQGAREIPGLRIWNEGKLISRTGA